MVMDIFTAASSESGWERRRCEQNTKNKNFFSIIKSPCDNSDNEKSWIVDHLEIFLKDFQESLG